MKRKESSVSHGSHSLDFLESYGWDSNRIRKEISGWNDTPILFLMENPSLDYGIYTYLASDTEHTGKRPSKVWYWIHRSNKDILETFDDDTYLRDGKYGEMISALIKQNKLANAYLTDILKCGMSDAEYSSSAKNKVIEKGYLGTNEYSTESKKNCISLFLSKEIKALMGEDKRLIIFTFGGNTYWMMKEYLIVSSSEYADKKIQLIQLPHPASRIKNFFRSFLLKGMVKEAIEKENFGSYDTKLLDKCISEQICHELSKYFAVVVGRRRRDNSLCIKVNVCPSFLIDSERIDSIMILSDSQETILSGDYNLCYSVGEDSFWIWDNKKKCPVDKMNPSLVKCFDVFKSIIEENK